MEVERLSQSEKPVPDADAEAEVERVEEVVPKKEETPDAGILRIDDVIEMPREASETAESGSIIEVDTPVAGSTMEDIGATESVNELVDLHVRTETGFSETRTYGSQEESVGSRSMESSVEAEGASKLSLPPKAPSLESMPASLKDVTEERVEERVGERVRQDTQRMADAVRPSAAKGAKLPRKQEFKRSDTLLDVRSSLLSVKTHVTNYEKIEAAARVDAEELVKSGRAQFAAASG